MSAYSLIRFTSDDEPQPTWLLTFPGCSDRPLAIPEQNLDTLFAAYLRQRGELPELEQPE